MQLILPRSDDDFGINILVVSFSNIFRHFGTSNSIITDGRQTSHQPSDIGMSCPFHLVILSSVETNWDLSYLSHCPPIKN